MRPFLLCALASTLASINISCSEDSMVCDGDSKVRYGEIYSDGSEFFLFMDHEDSPYYYQLDGDSNDYTILEDVFRKGVGFRNGARIKFCGIISDESFRLGKVDRKTVKVENVKILRERNMDDLVEGYYRKNGMEYPPK